MRKPSKNSESNKHPAGRKFCRLNFFIKIYRNLLTVQIIYAIIIKSLIRSISAIKYGRFPEWPKGTDCKSVVTDFSGSNPLSPTKIGEYLLILADFYFPMGFVNVIKAVSPTVANRKE